MTKRTVAVTVAGLAVAGAIAGVKYANRQPAVSDTDRLEIEEFGESLGEMGKGLHRVGKGLHRVGKGLHRMGSGMSRSFEEPASGRNRD
jgi:hypothetical protein